MKEQHPSELSQTSPVKEAQEAAGQRPIAPARIRPSFSHDFGLNPVGVHADAEAGAEVLAPFSLAATPKPQECQPRPFTSVDDSHDLPQNTLPSVVMEPSTVPSGHQSFTTNFNNNRRSM